jgi:cell division protein FtsL
VAKINRQTWFLIGSCVMLNIGGVFLLIHKHTRVIQLSFQHQRLEKQYQELVKQKKLLHEQLLAVSDRSSVKKFAQEELHMEPVKLQQIHSVPS